MRAALSCAALVTVAGALAACGSQTARESAGPVEIREDLAPVPFAPGALAEHIRAGATMTFRVDEAGEEPYLQTTEFVRTGAEGATMRAIKTDLEGEPLGEPQTAEATWKELESHAHFPRQATAISNDTVAVPAGRFQAYLYQVELDQQGVTVRSRFWFARDLPGPPVKLVQEAGGEVATTMVLVESERP